MRSEHLLEHGRRLVHDVVGQQDRERRLADVLTGHGDGVAESERRALTQVMNVGHLRDVAHLFELLELAGRFEIVLQFEAAIEVILERTLASAGDHEDVA